MPQPNDFTPATNLAQAYNAVNPDLALHPGDSRYVDFSEWRGDEHIRMVARRITRADQAQPVQHLKQLVTGHRGCGKTTELLRLKAHLEEEGYFVVYFNSALELDMNDVDYTDILLTTMYQLARQVNTSDLGLKLREKQVESLRGRLGQIIKEEESLLEVESSIEAEIGTGFAVPFLKVLAVIKSKIKNNATQKETIRTEIKQRIPQFLEDLNDLINNLQTQLSDLGKQGLVIIIDSLDRIIPHALDEERRRTRHTEIFIEHAEHLKAPRCHIVYTVPISIHFNENLSTVYTDKTVTIPMIKVRHEDASECEGGLEAIYQSVEKRINIEAVFENPTDVNKLALASGGHIRDLMHLVRYACDYSDEQITTDAVDRAIRALTREYDRLVKDRDLPRLVKVHRERRLPTDPEYALLPYHLIVLEYQNAERWADVHPAVQETRKFKKALEDARAEPQAEAAE